MKYIFLLFGLSKVQVLQILLLCTYLHQHPDKNVRKECIYLSCKLSFQKYPYMLLDNDVSENNCCFSGQTLSEVLIIDLTNSLTEKGFNETYFICNYIASSICNITFYLGF